MKSLQAGKLLGLVVCRKSFERRMSALYKDNQSRQGLSSKCFGIENQRASKFQPTFDLLTKSIAIIEISTPKSRDPSADGP